MFMALPPTEVCFCWLVKHTDTDQNELDQTSACSASKCNCAGVWRTCAANVYVNSVCLAISQISNGNCEVKCKKFYNLNIFFRKPDLMFNCVSLLHSNKQAQTSQSI